MMTKEMYCKKCGRELVEGRKVLRGYSGETGEPLIEEWIYCPSSILGKYIPFWTYPEMHSVARQSPRFVGFEFHSLDDEGY